METRGRSSATPATEASAPARLVWRTAEVTGVRGESARTRRLSLRVDGWAGHVPGQHLDVRLTAADGYQAQRSYSVASAPEPSRLELLVDHIPDGEVSPYLAREVRPGDRFEIRGPIGGYFVWTAALGGPLLLVAGGSGIAPLASILAYRDRAAAGVPTHLLYSARGPDDVAFSSELDSWARRDPTLVVSLTLTRNVPADWRGYRGRIDAQMLRTVAFPPGEWPLAYVCGPTAMVEDTAAGLVGLGYAADRVRTERFGPSGDGT